MRIDSIVIEPVGPNLALMLGAAACFGVAVLLIFGGFRSLTQAISYGSWVGPLVGVVVVVALIVGGIVMAVRYDHQADQMPFLGGLTAISAQVVYLLAVAGGLYGGRRLTRGY